MPLILIRALLSAIPSTNIDEVMQQVELKGELPPP